MACNVCEWCGMQVTYRERLGFVKTPFEKNTKVKQSFPQLYF